MGEAKDKKKKSRKIYNTMLSPVMTSMTSFLQIVPNRNLLPENSQKKIKEMGE